jgi:3-oxoacyl-[acyl-carrier-protein] synthase-3
MNFTITGTGSALPKKVVVNDDLSEIVDTSDEWIKKRTGISSRRILSDETLTDIACKAAEAAVTDSKIDIADLDLIIVSTIRGDYFTPSLACIIQGHIGASCPSFDISAACTGFIYALDIANSYFMSDRVKNILIVSADAMSHMVDWNHRSTCVLFGDGAGAVMLSKGNDLLSIKITAESNIDTINIPNVIGNCPFSSAEETSSFISMNGKETYKFAVAAILKNTADVAQAANIDLDDIDYFLIHQANIRIIEAAQQRMNISPEKFLCNIETTGNTSSATIPILLDQENKKGTFKPGDILVLNSFGAGLTTGAAIIRWGKKTN